jgi:hypothetical protein
MSTQLSSATVAGLRKIADAQFERFKKLYRQSILI